MVPCSCGWPFQKQHRTSSVPHHSPVPEHSAYKHCHKQGLGLSGLAFTLSWAKPTMTLQQGALLSSFAQVEFLLLGVINGSVTLHGKFEDVGGNRDTVKVRL